MTHPLTTIPWPVRLRAALITLIGAPAPTTPNSAATPAVITDALARAHHHNETVTVRTRGGHVLPRSTVTTVQVSRPRYAVLTSPGGAQLVLPLRFIETVESHSADTTATPDSEVPA